MTKVSNNDVYNEFKESRERKPGFISKIKQFFKKNKNVEVLEENETNLLDNNYSDEAIISIEDDSKNFKSVKSDNARGKGRVPASHDDEPMKFWFLFKLKPHKRECDSTCFNKRQY